MAQSANRVNRGFRNLTRFARLTSLFFQRVRSRGISGSVDPAARTAILFVGMIETQVLIVVNRGRVIAAIDRLSMNRKSPLVSTRTVVVAQRFERAARFSRSRRPRLAPISRRAGARARWRAPSGRGPRPAGTPARSGRARGGQGARPPGWARAEMTRRVGGLLLGRRDARAGRPPRASPRSARPAEPPSDRLGTARARPPSHPRARPRA